MPSLNCTECGAGVTGDSPLGLCTKCLLNLGLSDSLESSVTAQTETPGVHSKLPALCGPDSIGAKNGQFANQKSKIPCDGYFGDYQLLEEIARGGMGIVFKARQVSLNRIVAIKMIAGGHLASSSLVERFHTEAESAANLDHPNIVPIYEIGEHEGQHYFSMKLIEGGDLAKQISDYALPKDDLNEGYSHRSTKSETTQRQIKVANLMVTIARAVHHAHQRGILHRDLKPSNILIDTSKQPHITDFGLAKLIERGSNFTQTMTVMGTPSYMSPEQAAGSTKALSTATDIFSLGAMFYELLTTQPPFRGQTPVETMRQVQEEEPARPRLICPRIDRDLETICLKCLEKEPAKRYESAEEFAKDLENWLRKEPVKARCTTRFERVVKWVRRKPAIAILIAALNLVASTGLWGVLWHMNLAMQRAEDLRHESYASDMNLAYQRLKENNRGGALELLDQHRPQTQQDDLRNWEWRYLWQQTRSEALFELCQRQDQVGAVAFSRNGLVIAVSDGNSGVSFWNVATRKEDVRLRINGGFGWGRGIAFSPVGDLFAACTASSDGNPKFSLWDTQTAEEQVRLLDNEFVLSAEFSQNGELLAAFTHEGWVRVWRVKTGARVKDISVSARTLDHGRVTFSPRGDFLAIGEGNGRIRLFDVVRWSQKAEIQAAADGINSLAFSWDGSVLASASSYSERIVKLWDVATGKQRGVLAGHRGYIRSLAFAPDTRFLASASVDQTIRIWDIHSLTEVNVLSGHLLEVWAIAFSPDGKLLASGCKDGSVYIWNSFSKKQISSPIVLPEKISRCSFSPDSRSLATLGRGNGALSIWDISTQIRSTEMGEEKYAELCFRPGGKEIALATIDGRIEIWNIEHKRQIGSFDTQIGGISLLKFLDSGRLLAVVDIRRGIQIWQAGAWKLKSSWEFDEPYSTRLVFLINRIAISPDEQFIARAQDDGTVSIWELWSGRRIAKLSQQRRMPSGIAFTPEGEHLVTASTFGVLQIWKLSLKKEIAVLRGHLMAMESLAISPDGSRLASPSGSELRIWDFITRREVASLPLGGAIHFFTEFAPDGNSLIVLDAAGDAQLFRAPPFQKFLNQP